MKKLLVSFLLLFSLTFGQIVSSNTNTGFTSTNIRITLTNASIGHTVVVFTGVYNEQISFNGRNGIKLIAWDWIVNTNNTTTVINATGLNPAIVLTAGISNRMEGFTVTNATAGSGMIYATTSSTRYNCFVNNIFNKTTGTIDIINIGGPMISNCFISNVIMNAGGDGFETFAGGVIGTRFFRNLIISNAGDGLFFNGGEGKVEVINNTFAYNLMSGIDMNGAGTGRGNVINNIFISNGNGAGEYGLDNNGSAVANNVTNGYNLYFSNFAGPWAGANTYSYGTNYTNNVYPDLNVSYLISASNSGAVDKGTNYSGVTDGYSGGSPDVGWREFVQAVVDNVFNFFLDF